MVENISKRCCYRSRLRFALIISILFFLAVTLHVVPGEQVGWIRHELELQVVVGRVLEEHRELLPALALEPSSGFNDKLDPRILDTLRQCIELSLGLQHAAEMWNRDLVSVHRIEVVDASVLLPYEVHDELVTGQGEVYPLPLTASPLSQTQCGPVERPGLCEVVYRDREVERASWSWSRFRLLHSFVGILGGHRLLLC